MNEYHSIPDWIVANLSNPSAQQQVQALLWAIDHLYPTALYEYYRVALYYRPMMRRDIQKLVDNIGLKLSSLGGNMGYGYMTNGQMGNLAISAADVDAWVDTGGKILNTTTSVASGIMDAFAKGRCLADYTAPGCPGYQPGNGGGGGGPDHWGAPPTGRRDAPPPQQPPPQQPPPRDYYNDGRGSYDYDDYPGGGGGMGPGFGPGMMPGGGGMGPGFGPGMMPGGGGMGPGFGPGTTPPKTTPPKAPVAPPAAKKDNTLLYVGLGLAAAYLLMQKK